MAPLAHDHGIGRLLPNALAMANVRNVQLGLGRFGRPAAGSVDFAQVTGQRVVVSDEVTQHVLGVARQIISPKVRAGDSFADPVEAGPDADILDRLVAFTGRSVTSAPFTS
jgi:hypothetical protein